MSLIICYTTCWACRFDHHKSKWHTWADGDDIEHAERTGRPDPREQRCGCYCQREGYWRKDRKRQAIEARQVARAVRGIEWAPPLLRNGRAAR